ncbi:hypothetical protein OE88DRAFT_1665309 [Heliocybe sulcata]|uniref:Uncharacterized protein n=1 Tax=Heliocybe sulcata TaxID=5364 RepID=A0A5C3MQM5_9AGAM|nr:hypothetical protein OE88DRAFT_1665309 [Heliocybe sulcata]
MTNRSHGRRQRPRADVRAPIRRETEHLQGLRPRAGIIAFRVDEWNGTRARDLRLAYYCFHPCYAYAWVASPPPNITPSIFLQWFQESQDATARHGPWKTAGDALISPSRSVELSGTSQVPVLQLLEPRQLPEGLRARPGGGEGAF